MDTEVEDFLEHFGVKGMKWGVRKERRSGTGAAKPVKPGSNRGKNIGSRSYDAKKLSNADLNRVVKRMRLEQEYASLNKKASQKGDSFAKKLLQKEGSKALLSAAKTHGPTVLAAILAGGGVYASGRRNKGYRVNISRKVIGR